MAPVHQRRVSNSSHDFVGSQRAAPFTTQQSTFDCILRGGLSGWAEKEDEGGTGRERQAES